MPKFSYTFIVTSVLLYAMFQSFWYLGNIGFYATNDTVNNMSGHFTLVLVKALKAPLQRIFFKIIGGVINDRVNSVNMVLAILPLIYITSLSLILTSPYTVKYFLFVGVQFLLFSWMALPTNLRSHE